MKVLCVIDSLGSGGAQRQMVNLSCGLKARGHEVEMFVYFPQFSFFRPEVEAAQIPIREVRKGRGFSFKVLFTLTSLLRKQKFDAVISFLSVPNFYSEVAKLLAWSPTPLIVSERNSSLSEPSRFRSSLFGCLHYFASAVVANSKSHADWLCKTPWLRSKTYTIYNGYNIPQPASPRHTSNRLPFHYLVVGRIHKQKNGLKLIEALTLYAAQNLALPSISWAGRQETDDESVRLRKDMEKRLDEQKLLKERWEWLGERNDIPKLLTKCDALIHVSLYEGLPNVVCEAFIAGCPVIASNVCDHPLLINEPARGFVCDPQSPESICNAIERFESQSNAERAVQGRNARAYAETNLSVRKMVDEYEKLIAILRKRPSWTSHKKPTSSQRADR